MNPHSVWCTNLACPARGQQGKGNITIHSRKEHRYHCSLCEKTFGARSGTPFHRRRTDEHIIILVITLVSWAVPLSPLSMLLAFILKPFAPGLRLPDAMLKRFIMTSSPSLVTSDRFKPMKFASKRSAALCGWRWP